MTALSALSFYSLLSNNAHMAAVVEVLSPQPQSGIPAPTPLTPLEKNSRMHLGTRREQCNIGPRWKLKGAVAVTMREIAVEGALG